MTMVRSYAFGGLILAAAFSGCQTTEIEKQDYKISDAKSGSILDSRIKKLEEDVVKYPLRADLHYEIASLYAKKGDCRESVRSLEKAIELSPLEAKYHFHLGRLFLNMNELTRAESEFRQALQLSREGRYTGPHAALGWTLSLKHDVDGAIEEFENCVRIEPANAIFYFFLGSLHDMKGDREKAIHNFQEYLALGGSTYRRKTTDILRSLGVATADIPEAANPGQPARDEQLFGPTLEGSEKAAADRG